MANGGGLASVQSVVVLMLENRSFDHMLGFSIPATYPRRASRSTA